jgi:hypothetical protein
VPTIKNEAAMAEMIVPVMTCSHLYWRGDPPL